MKLLNYLITKLLNYKLPQFRNSVIRKFSNSRPAFTLVELLVVIFISAIVMGIMTEVFIGTWRAQLNQEARTQLQQSSRASLDVLTTTARQANGVIDTLTVNGTTYTTNSNTIILKLAALDDTGAPTDLTDYIIFRYSSSATATSLERVISADPSSSRASQTTPINLTSELSSIVIQYFDSSGSEIHPNIAGGISAVTTSSIRFDISTHRLVNGQNIVSQLDDLAQLRNR